MTHYDVWLFVLISFALCSQGSNPVRHFQFQIHGVSVADQDFKNRMRRQSGYEEPALHIGQSPLGSNQQKVAPATASYLQPISNGYEPSGSRPRRPPVARPTSRAGYESTGVQQPPSGSLNNNPSGSLKSKVRSQQKTKTKPTKYYYPPRMPLPLPTCFHNPTGYVCCNRELNDLIVDTYTELEVRPKFHVCNINALAKHLQVKAQEKFTTDFETVVSFEDFAQKIHFKNDLVCKVEVGGKYMLAYGTVRDVGSKLPLGGGDEKIRAKRDYTINTILI